MVLLWVQNGPIIDPLLPYFGPILGPKRGVYLVKKRVKSDTFCDQFLQFLAIEISQCIGQNPGFPCFWRYSDMLGSHGMTNIGHIDEVNTRYPVATHPILRSGGISL